ncbi:MAG: hypothetical protein WCV99_21675 [Sterolibacterium sp.]|jgi:DNA-binding response OmpR family regulator
MGINLPVLTLAFISDAAACNGDLHDILRKIAQRLTLIAPQDAIRDLSVSCDHALVVVDGYALGTDALVLCRRLRLAGLTQSIALAWMHHTDLDRAACREYGIDEIIFRPFVTGKVSATILSLASNWQPRIEGRSDHRSRKHVGNDGYSGAGLASVLGATGGRTELRTA